MSLPEPSSADEALELLYAEHYRRLVRLATLLLRDRDHAEEVVQDAFVAVYRRWDELREANLPAYLRQTVVNRSRSAVRHLVVVARHRPEPLRDGAPADAALLASERRRAVLDALAELPTRQREVLALRHYLDLTEQQIAETLGISNGSVKTHASRGAAALRHLLRPLQENS